MWTFCGEREIACWFSSACLGLRANGPVAWVLTLMWLPPHLLLPRLLPTRLLLPSGPGQPVHSHRPRQALENGRAISLSPRNVHVAMLFKLLGWAGRPAPCALCVFSGNWRAHYISDCSCWMVLDGTAVLRKFWPVVLTYCFPTVLSRLVLLFLRRHCDSPTRHSENVKSTTRYGSKGKYECGLSLSLSLSICAITCTLIVLQWTWCMY